jgi:hypothetical protein
VCESLSILRILASKKINGPSTLTFAKVFQPHGIKITNYYADTGEWIPAAWFLSKEHRELVKSETMRIKKYRSKGDLL